MNQYISIWITTPNKDHAHRIGDALLSRRLVACCQIEGPIRSRYRWDDELQEDKEYRLMLKTITDHFVKIEELVKRLHPYDVPQIIALPILMGAQEYLDWITREVS